MDPDDRRYSPEIVRNYSLRSRNVMRKGSHYKTKTKRPIITTSLSEENAILISYQTDNNRDKKDPGGTFYQRAKIYGYHEIAC